MNPRLLALVAAALVALPALAAPPGLAQGAEGAWTVVVQDAPDDARERDTTYVAAVGSESACRAVMLPSVEPPEPAPPPPEGCATARGAAPPKAGGEPAPPSMEALSASFADTPEHLLVGLELAQIEPRFAGAVQQPGPAGSAGAIYEVCWTSRTDACGPRSGEKAVLAAMPAADGGIEVIAFYALHSESCNDYVFCAWRVPHEIEAGSPGRIVWRIPRALLPHPQEGTVLDAPVLTVQRYVAPEGRATWPAQDGKGWGFVGPRMSAQGHNQSVAVSGYTGTYTLAIDSSDPGTAYRIGTPARPGLPGDRFARWEDATRDVAGDTARADIDVLAVELVETDVNLTFAIQLARVDEAPADHYIEGAMGLPNGRFLTFGYGVRESKRHTYGYACGVPACHAMPDPDLRSVELSLKVVPGAPGWANFTFDRATLGEPARGELVNYIDVLGYTYDETGSRDTGQQARVPANLITRVSGEIDVLAIGPPWWFAHDTRLTVLTSGFFVQDPTGDAQATSSTPPGTDLDRFDITYVEAVGVTPAISRVTIGIADLSTLDPALGSRGALYVVGLRLAGGTSTMVGLYYETTPANGGRRDFFCGSDTAAFVAAPRDPASSAWRTIGGDVNAPSSVDTTGAGQRGSIVVLVPHECFGLFEPGPLDFEAAVGRSFLLPATRSDELPFEPLDEVVYDQPFTLQATAIEGPGVPWYAEPFGIAAFWDIFGIMTAAAGTMLAAVAVRRRRRRLSKWLDLVDRTLVEHERRPRELEAALVRLRTLLRDDLMHERIEHAHFTLIDKRIEEARSKARVHHLAETFDDLPHRLLRRLEELLADGSMTRADYRAFSEMLEETALRPEAKDAVRRKLQHWVREDEESLSSATPGARNVPVT